MPIAYFELGYTGLYSGLGRSWEFKGLRIILLFYLIIIYLLCGLAEFQKMALTNSKSCKRATAALVLRKKGKKNSS